MKYFLAIASAVLFIYCNEKPANSYTLSGEAQGFKNGTQIYLYEVNNNNQPSIKDTLRVTDNTFSSSYPIKEKTVLSYLIVEGTRSNILFFSKDQDLNVTIYKDSISSSFINGGEENDLYARFQKKTKSFETKKRDLNKAFNIAQKSSEETNTIQKLRQESITLTAEEKTFRRNFVKENSNTTFGTMLLSEMFNQEDLNTTEVSEILKNMDANLLESNTIKRLKNSIEAKKKASVGGTAPDFEAPTPTGETLALKDVLGEYTIIDFWASWCKPCRIENPNVVNVYKKYHSKGLNIISVSLDRPGQKDRWIKAIETDNMNWHHVSNLKFWQEPIARQYNVRSIPATFLLDKNGKIIDKNLRGSALETKIAALLD